MNILSLCSGIGGLDLAAERVFDAKTAALFEIDDHASKVLSSRFDAPNFGDLRGQAVAEIGGADIVAAGFPCQDISAAGKGEGLNGPRSGLWFDVLDVVYQSLPTWIVIENVPLLKARGLDVVLAGLEDAGYGGSWCYWRSGYKSKNPSRFPHVDGCHQRKRLFILARYGKSGFEERQAWRYSERVEANVPRLFATPTAWLGRRPSQSDLSNPAAFNAGSGSELVRDDVATLLPTPAASRSGNNQGGGMGRVGPVRHSLDSIDKLLPTPVVTDSKGARNATDRPDTRKGNPGTTLSDVCWSNTWGDYAPAIARWAEAFGTPPPDPTVVTEAGAHRLSPVFVEWMMGYPAGWVTDLDIPRTKMLQCLGNAVQPQTAVAALRHLKGTII